MRYLTVLAVAVLVSGCALLPPTSAKDERGQEAADATEVTPSSEPKCRALADSLSLEAQISQLFMMGVTKTGLTDSLAAGLGRVARFGKGLCGFGAVSD